MAPRPTAAPAPASTGATAAAWRTLSSLERDCLVALCLRDQPQNRTHWSKWLATLGIRHGSTDRAPKAKRSSGRKVSSTDLRDLLDRGGLAPWLYPLPRAHDQYFLRSEAVPFVVADPRSPSILKAALSHFHEEELEKQAQRFLMGSRAASLRASALSAARAAMCLGEPALCEQIFARAVELGEPFGFERSAVPDPILDLVPLRWPLVALELLPKPLLVRFLEHALPFALEVPASPAPEVLRMVASSSERQLRALQPVALTLQALGSTSPDAGAALPQEPTTDGLQARAILALRAGDVQGARRLTLEACQVSRGPKGKKQPYLDGPLAPLLTLVLATGEGEARAAAAKQVERAQRRRTDRLAHAPVAMLLAGQHPSEHRTPTADTWQCSLLALLVGCYLGLPADDGDWVRPWFDLDGFSRVARQFDAVGLGWLAAQLRGALSVLSGQAMDGADVTLAKLMTPVPTWKLALQRLQDLAATASQTSAAKTGEQSEPQQRLVYLLALSTEQRRRGSRGQLDVDSPDFPEFVRSYLDEPGGLPRALIEEIRQDFRGSTLDDLDLPPAERARFQRFVVAHDDDDAGGIHNLLPAHIEARVQKRTAKGYSRGKGVSLRRLYDGAQDLPFASEQDHRVAAALTVHRDWHGQREYSFGPMAIKALVGHPHLFRADLQSRPPVALVEGSFQLRLVTVRAGLCLRLSPTPDPEGMALYLDAQGRLTLCTLTPQQRGVYDSLRHLPAVPPAGRADLHRTLTVLASLFPVHAEEALSSDEGGSVEVQADSRPTALLRRAEQGVCLNVVAMPLGTDGPRLLVGAGLPVVACALAGQATRCTRDLQAERAALEQAATVAPELLLAAQGQALEVDALGPCLRLLQNLRQLHESVHVLWTEGEPMTVLQEADGQQLDLRLNERQRWLEVDGSLQVDEDLVLSLGELLRSPTVGAGFVQLDKDRYLPLSTSFSEQLSTLAAAGTPVTSRKGAKGENADAGTALRLPPVALGFVSPWLRELQGSRLTLNDRAKRRLQAIDDAMASNPQVPTTLEAQLRPYQLDGYRFLSRIAQAGAGAVLADDMGLGKTLMTLALLVERAPQGPALVVAPVSVKANWCDEALRFAPSLRIRRADRGHALPLADLGPFDVLVCSYAVMSQQVDALSEVTWTTLALDEAQAIKNAATQRAKAARQLVAEARVALTGTPVENHLGDLYSLMTFLNPGLLGTAKQFKERFGKPIQSDGDQEAARALRAIIAPFILRRRKAQVLRELPPKTEILVQVEPEPKERAFVEALRRDALERMKKLDPREGAVSILAEITRLRRAACHPMLVNDKAGAKVGAAKLERLVDILHNLKAEGHRALVFSQFVDFLRIVGAALGAEGFSYQYLDGSTSEAARAQAVRAFQSGEGDAFLISLKAGGFGLNLTAADYVIHLDPWWNPAVEDQASDRAHRIGQQRPVTVYRLVNAGSIEERVLSLHALKRELAEDLLQGTSQATRLDTTTLMSLLQ